MKNDDKTISQLLEKIESLNTKISLQKKDISGYKQEIVKIQDENKITNIALDRQMDTFFLFDPITNKAVQWNKSFTKISGYIDDEIAKLPAPGSYYSSKDLERAGKFIQNIVKGTILRAPVSGPKNQTGMVLKSSKRLRADLKTKRVKSLLSQTFATKKAVAAIMSEANSRKRKIAGSSPKAP